MAGKKTIRDYEGDIYVTNYAAGIAELLRELADLNEATVLEFIKQGRHKQPDFFRRLSSGLSKNLRQQVQKTYDLATLTNLSLRAMRTLATHPIPKAPDAETIAP